MKAMKILYHADEPMSEIEDNVDPIAKSSRHTDDEEYNKEESEAVHDY